MQYIKKFKPAVAIFENVRQLLHQRAKDDKKRPVQIMMDELSMAGYSGHWLEANCMDWGLPQSRPRAWLVFVYRGENKPARIMQLLTDMTCAPPALSSFLVEAPPLEQQHRAKKPRAEQERQPAWISNMAKAVALRNIKMTDVEMEVKRLCETHGPHAFTKRQIYTLAVHKQDMI